MQLYSIEGNTQRLDGGSMYGNCPRAVWERWSPPDERHRIALACRSLLVREESGRVLLLETGIGAFFEPNLRDRYGVVEPEHVLLDSLARMEITPADVDVVVLSHLHFDHAGGLLTPWSDGEEPTLAFPNARFLVGDQAWKRAMQPHPRDRASFIPRLQTLLQDSGRLEIIEGESSATLGERYSFSYSDGHTPGLMLTRVATPRGAITFMGDLIPGVPWVHLPITMGYDRHPEMLIDEKREMLQRIHYEDEWVFFTHDPQVAAARIDRDDRGRFSAVEQVAKLVWE